MATPLRTKSVTAKITEEEFQQLESLAQKQELTVSEWCREVLLSRINSPQHDEGNSNEANSADEIILAEILGVRMLLLNLLYPLGRGESLNPEKIQAVIAQADAQKFTAAIKSLGSKPKRQN